MSHKSLSVALLLALSVVAAPAFAIDSTLTYQGSLEDAGQPANGAYDLQFDLQDINAALMPTNAAALFSLAQSDVNARAALSALSLVKVQVSSTTANQLGLYDATTNPGGLTDTWLTDRAGMLQALANTRPGQNARGS